MTDQLPPLRQPTEPLGVVVVGLPAPASDWRSGLAAPEEAAEHARGIAARGQVTADDVYRVLAEMREARS